MEKKSSHTIVLTKPQYQALQTKKLVDFTPSIRATIRQTPNANTVRAHERDAKRATMHKNVIIMMMDNFAKMDCTIWVTLVGLVLLWLRMARTAYPLV